jgi:hypothetical protein
VNGRCELFIGNLVLKHQKLFRSGRLVFGLKPDLNIASLPGAKAPGYLTKRLSQGSLFYLIMDHYGSQ